MKLILPAEGAEEAGRFGRSGRRVAGGRDISKRGGPAADAEGPCGLEAVRSGRFGEDV